MSREVCALLLIVTRVCTGPAGSTSPPQGGRFHTAPRGSGWYMDTWSGPVSPGQRPFTPVVPALAFTRRPPGLGDKFHGHPPAPLGAGCRLVSRPRGPSIGPSGSGPFLSHRVLKFPLLLGFIKPPSGRRLPLVINVHGSWCLG